MTKKKAQHEMVGFVIIVVLVVIVAVIFLGISLRKQQGIQQDDDEILNFLESANVITSDCVFKILFADTDDLADGCRSNKKCEDERPACEVLNSTYSNLLENIDPAGAERPIKYKRLEIFYQSDVSDPTTRQAPFLELEYGDRNLCVERRAGQISRSGIITRLEICKGVD